MGLTVSPAGRDLGGMINFLGAGVEVFLCTAKGHQGGEVIHLWASNDIHECHECHYIVCVCVCVCVCMCVHACTCMVGSG